MVTTLFTPVAVRMPGLAAEDDDDDGEVGAGGRRLARMMLLPWPAWGCPLAGVMRRGRSWACEINM